MSAPRVTFDRVVHLKDGLQVNAQVVARVETEVGAGHGYETHFEMERVLALDNHGGPNGFRILIGAELLFDLTPECLKDLERTAEREFSRDCEAAIVETNCRVAARRLRAQADPSPIVASTEGEVAL